MLWPGRYRGRSCSRIFFSIPAPLTGTSRPVSIEDSRPAMCRSRIGLVTRRVDYPGDIHLQVVIRGLAHPTGSQFRQVKGTHLVPALTGSDPAHRAKRARHSSRLSGLK